MSETGLMKGLPRARPGPKPKRERELYIKKSITLSPEMYRAILAHSRENESFSRTIQRLLMNSIK